SCFSALSPSGPRRTAHCSCRTAPESGPQNQLPAAAILLCAKRFFQDRLNASGSTTPERSTCHEIDLQNNQYPQPLRPCPSRAGRLEIQRHLEGRWRPGPKTDLEGWRYHHGGNSGERVNACEAISN